MKILNDRARSPAMFLSVGCMLSMGCGDDDNGPELSEATLAGVVILDFEGAPGFVVPSELPINGLTAGDLAATGGSGVAAIQTETGENTAFEVPLEVNPAGPNLFVSLGDDAGSETSVTLSILEVTGTGFIGPGSGNGDDAFDGVAATEVAADFLEIAPGASVTFAYAGLPPGGVFTIASFSSNVTDDIDSESSGAATVGGTSVDFFPAAESDAGIGTLFSFPDVTASSDGTLEITFSATGSAPTFVSGFFISGTFAPSP
ncbi:MAG: hypothetical protein ACFB9M_10580 [Myxococcota bacterium]